MNETLLLAGAAVLLVVEIMLVVLVLMMMWVLSTGQPSRSPPPAFADDAAPVAAVAVLGVVPTTSEMPRWDLRAPQLCESDLARPLPPLCAGLLFGLLLLMLPATVVLLLLLTPPGEGGTTAAKAFTAGEFSPAGRDALATAVVPPLAT